MDDKIIKHNWVEVALKQWDQLLQDSTTEIKDRPNRSLLTGLIGMIFSTEKSVTSGANWVDLSSVNSENFFSPASQNLILQRLSNSIGSARGSRLAAFQCLRGAYEVGFNLEQTLPKHEILKGPRYCNKPAARKKSDEEILTEAWKAAAFVVLEKELQVESKDLPKEAEVESCIQNILEKLKVEFGNVSYRQFVKEDDIIDMTEELLDAEIAEFKGTSKESINVALKIAAARLPVPKR